MKYLFSLFIVVLSLNLYKNGSDYGYEGELRSNIDQSSSSSGSYPFCKTFIAELSGGDDLELYYTDNGGSATEISFYNLNFVVKRLK